MNETTGWALFEKGCLTRWGQCPTINLDDTKGAKKGEKQVDWFELDELFCLWEPTYVVCEDYRIYAHKLQRHTFSDVQTLRLIGGIDLFCHLGWPEFDRPDNGFNAPDVHLPVRKVFQPIPIFYQMAVQAKGFITDDRLKNWDLWKPGMKHSRDAIRHGLYFLLISNRPKK